MTRRGIRRQASEISHWRGLRVGCGSILSVRAQAPVDRKRKRSEVEPATRALTRTGGQLQVHSSFRDSNVPLKTSLLQLQLQWTSCATGSWPGKNGFRPSLNWSDNTVFLLGLRKTQVTDGRLETLNW